MPGSFDAELSPFGLGNTYFSGWVDGSRLQPGRYRLVAAAHGARRRPARVGFTVIRQRAEYRS